MGFVQKLVAVGGDPSVARDRRRAFVTPCSPGAPCGGRAPGLHPDPGGAVLVYDPGIPGERARAIAAATAWIGDERAAGRGVDVLFVEADPDP